MVYLPSARAVPFWRAPGSLLQLDRCCGHPPIQVVLAGKCPSCHAKRLARWSLWLDQTLLAPVPHRQVVLTLPKRLRAYCLYRRPLLGDLARVAARTVTAAVRAVQLLEHAFGAGSRSKWPSTAEGRSHR